MSHFLGRVAHVPLEAAFTACPHEAREVERINRALLELPKDAPTGQAVDLYEQLLEARDRLADAWITHQMENPS